MKCAWLSTAPLDIRFRRHDCPACMCLLDVVKVWKVLRPGSEDALRVSQRTGIPVQQIGERRTRQNKGDLAETE